MPHNPPPDMPDYDQYDDDRELVGIPQLVAALAFIAAAFLPFVLIVWLGVGK